MKRQKTRQTKVSTHIFRIVSKSSVKTIAISTLAWDISNSFKVLIALLVLRDCFG